MDTKRVFIKAKQVLLKQKAVLAILAMLILMLFFNTQFYSVYNWMNVFRSATVQGIIAMGVTMTVLCAACDLSVGGIMCLSGVITVLMINSGMPIAVACLCALLAGAAVGLVNGFLVVHQRTEPFIITLGMGTLLGLPVDGPSEYSAGAWLALVRRPDHPKNRGETNPCSIVAIGMATPCPRWASAACALPGRAVPLMWPKRKKKCFAPSSWA